MMKYMFVDEYAQSSICDKLNKRIKLNKPLNIAFLDIDSTMTGSTLVTNNTRKKLERLGYAIVYVTARTEEMIMSSKQFDLSKDLGFKRPPPKLGRSNGKSIYIRPELIEPIGLLDPDIIAGSTGTQILIRQKKGGFAIDKIFEVNLLETNEAWRQSVMDLIHTFNKDKKKAYVAHYDVPRNYIDGTSNIYQPRFRVTISFQALKDKLAFRSFIRELLKNNHEFTNFRITDDSEPKKSHFVLYITPKNAGKRKAVDHIIQTLTKKLKIELSDLHVLIAGDGHADFDMGMKAARGTLTTFLIPSGSRLMPALRCKDSHPELLDDELEQLKTYLKALNSKGYYKSRLHNNRELIICDEIEKNSKAVESIYSQLQLIDKNPN